MAAATRWVTLKDSSRQQNGLASRYHDRVFIVSGKAPICGAYRPAVREQSFMAVPCRNDGFNCENQALEKLRTTGAIVEIGNFRMFMDRTTHTMPT